MDLVWTTAWLWTTHVTCLCLFLVCVFFRYIHILTTLTISDIFSSKTLCKIKHFLSRRELFTYVVLFFIAIVLSGVRLSPLGTAATAGLLYQPQMIDDGNCGMKMGRGNRSTRRKPAPAPLCPPQILHDHTLARTRSATVGSQRLTAWAMVRPFTQHSTPAYYTV
jgi:hypothetical protein